MPLKLLFFFFFLLFLFVVFVFTVMNTCICSFCFLNDEYKSYYLLKKERKIFIISSDVKTGKDKEKPRN